MKDIHVLKDVAYAAKQGGGVIASANEIRLLAPGAVAIVTEDGTLVDPTTVAGDITSANNWTVFVGVDNGSISNADQYPRSTKLIPRAMDYVNSKAYAAPANQVTVVGNDGVTAGASLNLPATLTVGDSAFLRIVRREVNTGAYPLASKQNSMHVASKVMRVEYIIKQGDAAADVVAGLVSIVNNHPENQGADKWVVADAIAANTGVRLTSQVYGQVFEIGTDELLRSADVIVTTNVNYGSGTGRQVAEQEQIAVTRFGDSSRFHLSKQLFDVAPQADVSETYETFVFKWRKPQTAVIASNSADAVVNEMLIFIPDGASDLADIKTVFNTVITSGGEV